MMKTPQYHKRIYDITNECVLMMFSRACVPICRSIDYLSRPPLASMDFQKGGTIVVAGR